MELSDMMISVILMVIIGGGILASVLYDRNRRWKIKPEEKTTTTEMMEKKGKK